MYLKRRLIISFNEEFTEENPQFKYLKDLNSNEAIEQKVDFLLSQFVLKFDAEQETEDDFIHYYLGQ